MTTKTDKFCSVCVEHRFTRQDVKDVLICAFEGGSNYWIDNVSRVLFVEGESIYDAAFNHGLVIELADDEHKGWKVILNSDSMRRGLQLLFDRYPRHREDILTDNADADTADCWLQCCLFSDIRYC